MHGHAQQPHESPWVVTVPLVLLAIPSLVIGWLTIGPVLFGDYFGDAIVVLPAARRARPPGEEFHGAAAVPRARPARSAPVVPRARRRARRVVPVHQATRAARRSSRALRRLYRLLAQQVLLRRAQPALVRRRQPRPRHGALARRRRRADRRRARQRLGADRRLAVGRRAPHAVGLSVSLRLRHDHRPVRAARLVRAARN